jgi:hypothetical protein
VGSADLRSRSVKVREVSISRLASAAGVFEPEDVDLLQRIFDQICKDRGYMRDCPEAGRIAASLFQLFHAGIYDETSFLVALSEQETTEVSQRADRRVSAGTTDGASAHHPTSYETPPQGRSPTKSE